MKVDGKAYALDLSRRDAGNMLSAFGPLLARGLKLYCLDAGNIFDPLPLVERLRAERLDLQDILQHQIFLSRAFTCHQLAGAVEKLLDPLAAKNDGRIAVMIMGIDEMFLDEDIRIKERRYLFGRILEKTRLYSTRGLPVLITCGQSGSSSWADALAGQATMISNIQQALLEIGSNGDGQDVAYIQRSA